MAEAPALDRLMPEAACRLPLCRHPREVWLVIESILTTLIVGGALAAALIVSIRAVTEDREADRRHQQLKAKHDSLPRPSHTFPSAVDDVRH